MHLVFSIAIFGTRSFYGLVYVGNGAFNDEFIAKLLMSVPVKDFLKSIRTCRSYGQGLLASFFTYNVLCSCKMHFFVFIPFRHS